MCVYNELPIKLNLIYHDLQLYHQIHANPEDWYGYTELSPPPLPVTSERGEGEGDVPPITGHQDSIFIFQTFVNIKDDKEGKISIYVFIHNYIHLVYYDICI